MIDEQLLIDRAQRGDMNAFRELVERSKINVYRLAYDLTGSRSDAEDLSQDVFVKAFRSLPGFRGSAKWSTWLYRITVNTCHSHRRSKAQRNMEYTDAIGNEDETVQYEDRDAANPDRSAEASMIRDNLDRALNKLTQQERSVFVLRHYHDLRLKQIADTMNIAEGTVKTYLFRAIQRLRSELASYGKELGLEGEPS